MSEVDTLKTLKKVLAVSIQRFKYIVENFGKENLPELSQKLSQLLASFKETDDFNVRVFGSSLQVYVLHKDNLDNEESSTQFCFEKEDLPSLYKGLYLLKNAYKQLLQKANSENSIGSIQEYKDRLKILL